MGKLNVKVVGPEAEQEFMQKVIDFMVGEYGLPVEIEPIDGNILHIRRGNGLTMPVDPVLNCLQLYAVMHPFKITVYYRRNQYEAMLN